MVLELVGLIVVLDFVDLLVVFEVTVWLVRVEVDVVGLIVEYGAACAETTAPANPRSRALVVRPFISPSFLERGTKDMAPICIAL